MFAMATAAAGVNAGMCMLALLVPASWTSLRLLADCKKVVVFWVAAVPRPRFVRAVLAVVVSSLRLLVVRRPPMVLALVGICPKAAASLALAPLVRLVIL